MKENFLELKTQHYGISGYIMLKLHIQDLFIKPNKLA